MYGVIVKSSRSLSHLRDEFLVMHSHFWSCDNDGSHTIRSAITESHILHTNFMGPCFVALELLELLLIKVLHCGNKNFGLVLFLWPWTSPDNFHVQTWPISLGDILDERKWTSYVSAFQSYRLTTIQTDRCPRNHIPCCFMSTCILWEITWTNTC